MLGKGRCCLPTFDCIPKEEERLPIFVNALVGVQSLEFPGEDNIVGADGFASWASCILAGNVWLQIGSGVCMPRPIRVGF